MRTSLIHDMIRLTENDVRDIAKYNAIENFTRKIKASKTLTSAQKSSLWSRARNGDLEGAEKEYRQIVSVRY